MRRHRLGPTSNFAPASGNATCDNPQQLIKCRHCLSVYSLCHQESLPYVNDASICLRNLNQIQLGVNLLFNKKNITKFSHISFVVKAFRQKINLSRKKEKFPNYRFDISRIQQDTVTLMEIFFMFFPNLTHNVSNDE